MSTLNKVFPFAISSEGFTGYPENTDIVMSYDSGYGNPSGSLKTRILGRNKAGTSYWEWVGTWEDLGIPSGDIVTQVRINNADNQCTEWNTVDACTIGPYSIYDSVGTTLIATLWTGRSPTGVEGSWTQIGNQIYQSIASAYEASNTTIRIRIYNTLDLGNNANAALSVYDDTISLDIDHEAVGAHDLTAVSIATTPVIGIPAATHIHVLTSTGIMTTSVAGTPTATHIHNLNATGITTTPVVGIPTVGQKHIFTVTGITTSPVVGTPTISEPSAEGIVINHLTDYDGTTSPVVTASISPTDGAVVFVFAAWASDVSDPAPTVDGCSGCGLTWERLSDADGGAIYGVRRWGAIYKGTGTPTSGPITINYTPTSGNVVDVLVSVDEVLELDGTTPHGTLYTDSSGGSRTIDNDFSILETADAGDFVMGWLGMEVAGQNLAITGDLDTKHFTDEDGSDIRCVGVAYDTDPTLINPAPGWTWDSIAYNRGWALILKAKTTVKDYWNFADEVSVPTKFTKIEGGSGAVSIVSDHLRVRTGGTASGDYAAAVYDTALDPSKLTIIMGEVKFSGQVGPFTPNILGLFDSSSEPIAMTEAARNSALRIWHEYQISTGADNFDRIQLKKKNSAGAPWQYVAATDTWQAAFSNTRAYFDEGSYYRFMLVFDGTTTPKRARGLVYGRTQNRGGTWAVNYDSSWRNFDIADADIDPIDNNLWVVFGDPSNDWTETDVTLDFSRIMIGEMNTANLDEFMFTNASVLELANFDYEIYKWYNPLPNSQTLWIGAEQFSKESGVYSPEIAHGSDVYVKDPYCYFDGTTYWLFYQRRVAGPGDGKIQVSSTTDILHGSWSSETDVSIPGAGEFKHEFPWVTKYDGTWYLIYSVELDAGDWRIEYKTTTATNPTSGWSSASTLLTAGAAGKFDDGGVNMPVLIWHSGTFTSGVWYMFYGGNDGASNWKAGLAKSTTGIVGTYTRVNDTDPIFSPQVAATTEFDGAHSNTRILTVLSTTSFVAGQKIFFSQQADYIAEILSIDSATQMTIATDIGPIPYNDTEEIRDFYYYSNAPRHPRYLNGTWIVYTTQFKFSAGKEGIGIWVDTTDSIDLADASFRPLRASDSVIDYLYPEFVLLEMESNENPGPVAEELTEPLVTDSVDNLTANSIITNPVVGTPSLGQTHALDGINITADSVLGTPSVGQEHALAGINITADSVLDTPILSHIHDLNSVDITADPVLDTPSVGQEHDLNSVDITADPILSTPSVGQEHALASVGITVDPILGTPILGTEGEDVLSAVGITTTPVVGTPSIEQEHVLDSIDTTSNPVLDTPILSHIHDLSGVGIITNLVLDTSSIGQEHALASVNITADPVLGTPLLSTEGEDNLTAVNITADPVFGTPSVGQVHALAGINVTADSVLGTPSVGQEHSLASVDITANLVLDTPVLSHIHDLGGISITAGPVLDVSFIGQEHALDSVDITVDPVLDTPLLSTEGEDNLVATGITVTPVVDTPPIGQEHVLFGTGIIITPVVGTPVLSSQGEDNLVATGIITSPVVETSTIGQIHVLNSTDIATIPVVGDPAIGQTHALSLNGIDITPVVATPILSHIHVLNAINVYVTPEIEISFIGQIHLLDSLNTTVTPILETSDFGQFHIFDSVGITTTPIAEAPAWELIEGIVDVSFDVLYLEVAFDSIYLEVDFETIDN